MQKQIEYKIPESAQVVEIETVDPIKSEPNPKPMAKPVQNKLGTYIGK